MSGKIVNLRQTRKRKTREAAEDKAADNRVKFGRTKEQKAEDAAASARRDKAVEQLEWHRMESDEPPSKS
tara:strand:+ start:1130 stop:1339 length:210 start_codon:yes stop_codon:yes gene_type:complete